MSIGAVINLCALTLLICLALCTYRRNKLWSAADKIFFILIITCIICTSADIVDVITNQNGKAYSDVTLYASSYLYFFLRNMTPFIYICYIITLSGRGYVLRKKPLFLLLLVIPAAVSLCLIAANPWNGGVFYYDADKVYHRGNLLPILYVAAIFYMFFSVIYIFRYRNTIEKEKRFAIYSFLPLSLGAVALQGIFPKMMVEMFATALCMMLIMFTLQKQEEVFEGTTGLWNREIFITNIIRAYNGGENFSVISINIENLRTLNRSIGYMQVDKLLIELAQYIKKYRMEAEGLYAMGNGKFNIILSDKKAEKGEKLAETLNQKFKEPWIHQGLELNLIAYIAVSNCPEDFEDKDELLRFTDSFHKYTAFSGEVFHAKELGKKGLLYREEIEKIIERAWHEKRFEVYYQPIYSVKEKRFTSAEALLRLYDEEYGFIPPDTFIPVAEENTSILKIGQFVLEQVCEFIAQNNLKEKGIGYIELNLSAVQCVQSDLAEQVLSTIRRYGLSPAQINLEVTETAAVYSREMMLKNMERLKKEGISFSLDDYGSGYSNINYLLQFPFTLIKLDKGIICGEKENHRNWIALKYSIEMLKEMGFGIVAEGVETKDITDDLAKQGCEYLQGYYFSKPVPGNEFLEYIQKHNIFD